MAALQHTSIVGKHSADVLELISTVAMQVAAVIAAFHISIVAMNIASALQHI